MLRASSNRFAARARLGAMLVHLATASACVAPGVSTEGPQDRAGTGASALTTLPLSRTTAPITIPVDLGSTGTSSAPVLILRATNVSLTARGTSLAVHYDRSPLSSPATVTLTGPGFAQTKLETAPTSAPLPSGAGSSGIGANTVTFTGLTPCTAYAYAVQLDGRTYASGSAHTLDANNQACGHDVYVRPSQTMTFDGYQHRREDHEWCAYGAWSDKYRLYPTGIGWHVRSHGNPNDEGASLRMGFEHFDDEGSGPFPCEESFVHVTRSQATYELDGSRLSDIVQVTAEMNYTSYRDGHEFDGLCAPELSWLSRSRAVPDLVHTFAGHNDFGQTWNEAVQGAGSDWILENHGYNGIPIQFEGGVATADLTSKVRGEANRAGTFSVDVGVAVANDGYGWLVSPNPSFARDNGQCATQLTNIVLHVTYAPPAPSTPTRCLGTVACGYLSVRCDDSSDVLSLHRISQDGTDVIVAYTSDARSELSDTGAAVASGARYEVCAENASGRSCAPLLSLTTGDASSCGTGGGGVGRTSGGFVRNKTSDGPKLP